MISRRILLFIILFIVGFNSTSFSQDSLPDRYHRYQGIVDTLGFMRDLYPQILSLDTMGYSTTDSVPMIRLKISDNPWMNEDEPAVFFCSGVHADEVLGPEVTFNFCENIVNRWVMGDSEVVNYIENLEIFVVPFINPEGRMVVESGDLAWRKNKSDNDTNGVFDSFDGVDNNRNYDIGWQYLGRDNSDDPTNLMFRGYEPFSESENIAMAEFGNKYKPVIAVDYHSPTYGRSEVVYYPWEWYTYSPDHFLIEAICGRFASSIERIHGDGSYSYVYGFMNKGDFKNFFYGHFGTIPFTVEISDTTIEDTLLVDDIVEDHLPGQYYLLERALGPGITGIIRDSVTHEILEAEVRIAERHSDQLLPRLSRPDYGRYRRLLDPGNYTAIFIKEGYDTLTITPIAINDTGYTELNAYLSPLAPRPPPPDLVYPIDDQVLRESDILLIWTRSDYDLSYLIQIDISPEFNSPLYEDSAIYTNSYSVNFPSTSMRYFWRVRSYNDNGWGPYSRKHSFCIDIDAKIDEQAELPENFTLLQNYPNPFNGETNIAFYVPLASEVIIRVYDIRGDLVALPVHKTFPAGWHNVKWNGRNLDNRQLASGIYFYRVEYFNKTISRRMIFLK